MRCAVGSGKRVKGLYLGDCLPIASPLCLLYDFDMSERRTPTKAQLESWTGRMEKLRAGIKRRHDKISVDERSALQREAAELRLIADTFFDEIKAIETRGEA